ncbi:hypothetical protein ACH5RR_015810 [Cinchona calisaya]|uniref:Uncharacterized protein n=1 Tax=Cinchona calisaya TaxID=153742 RepID=A0ABD2ZU48_9GENT
MLARGAVVRKTSLLGNKLKNCNHYRPRPIRSIELSLSQVHPSKLLAWIQPYLRTTTVMIHSLLVEGAMGSSPDQEITNFIQQFLSLSPLVINLLRHRETVAVILIVKDAMGIRIFLEASDFARN